MIPQRQDFDNWQFISKGGTWLGWTLSKMTITVRSLTMADELYLWEMLYQALHVPAGQPPFPRAIVFQPDISRYAEQWGRSGDEGVIAILADHPVGAAWLRLLTGAGRGYGYVDDTTPELSIAVLPGYRGQGIGSQLLTGLLENARLLFSGVCLSVTTENPARRLYDRFGFQVVKENDGSLTMVKRWGP